MMIDTIEPTLPESVARYCPKKGAIDWEEIEKLPWFPPMAACRQDMRWHAEGDVLTHTRLCCEWLIDSEYWNMLPKIDRQIVFLALLFHDSGKPATTRVESDGSISSKGHSAVGESIARRWLYENNVDPVIREEIACLIRFHQMPFHFLKANDPEKEVIKASLSCRIDLLYLHAMADNKGKISGESDIKGIGSSNDSVEMLWLHADEMNCLKSPFVFMGDSETVKSWTKFCYFHKDRSRFESPYDSSRLPVYMMSGLPASGKDSIIERQFGDIEMISLDDLRVEMRISPMDGPTEVVRVAKERAKALMRKSIPFVFNATSLTRKLRKEWVEFFGTYDAKVNIVHVETPFGELKRRNRNRSREVPLDVISSMLDIWQVPSMEEACEVTRIHN